MGILIVTNQFELGMLDESLTKTRGLAIGSPEMYDAQNLYAEYRNRDYHRVIIEARNNHTYQGEHEDFYYRKALHRLSRGNGYTLSSERFDYGSYTFQEDDHLMVIRCTHDPIFSDPEFEELSTKIYLFSF